MTAGWWWGTPEWAAYERLCGVATRRVDELAAATFWTRVIELRRPEEDLWRDVRKSYKSLIHHASRAYRVIAPLDVDEWMKRCQRLHVEQARRETRPAATWALMAEWAARGIIRLTIALPTGGFGSTAYSSGPAAGSSPAASTSPITAFCAVYEFDGHAYLGHLVSREPNVNTLLCWRAILAARARGCRTFETGWQGQATDAKGRGIEFWRRGFGGTDRPADPAQWEER